MIECKNSKNNINQQRARCLTITDVMAIYGWIADTICNSASARAIFEWLRFLELELAIA